MEYYLHKLEKNINKWLITNYENQQGKLRLFDKTFNDVVPYCQGDFIDSFVDEVVQYLSKQNYHINNINSFKDDMIRFFYKYTHDK